MTNPKVFVSHASEDKLEFAEPLSRLLREKGVDAWYDKWELVPGDNLVNKVFEEGLGSASTVVFLMSTNSLGKDKPWVRAELENAVHRHIEGKLRLIPVMLNECDVPQSLISILRINLEQEGSIEAVADRIVNTVYGYSEKPPLGNAPRYVNASLLRIKGLDQADELVLGLVFEAALTTDRRMIQSAHLLPLAKDFDIEFDALKESTEILCEMGYLLEKDRTLGRPRIVVELPASTMLDIASFLGMNVLEHQKELAGLIVNEGITGVDELQRRIDCPPGLTNAIIDVFEDNSYIRVARRVGMPDTVYSPSTGFKRWFRDA
jgi:hypothetical protein